MTIVVHKMWRFTGRLLSTLAVLAAILFLQPGCITVSGPKSDVSVQTIEEIRDDFTSRARQAGITFPFVPAIREWTRPSIISWRQEARAIAVPRWEELKLKDRALFESLAESANEGRRLFDLLCRWFLIPHELTHAVQHQVGLSQSHSQSEHSANAIAVAFYNESSTWQLRLRELEAALLVAERRLTVTVTDADLDQRYDELGQDPSKYAAFQIRSILNSLKRRHGLDFAHLISQLRQPANLRPPQLVFDWSMTSLCDRAVAGDPKVSSDIESHPLALKLVEGMRPDVVFSPREFGIAATSGKQDKRFSWDKLRARTVNYKVLYRYFKDHENLLPGLADRATEYLSVSLEGQTIPVRFVCGTAWDAFVLIFHHRPELFLDLGQLSEGDGTRMVQRLENTVTHELWHVAFNLHQAKLGWNDYKNSRDPVDRLAYEMLNEGMGHYYSLGDKMRDGELEPDMTEKFMAAFTMLKTEYPRFVSEADPEIQRRILWHSHAGVPFWEKWGAIPAAWIIRQLQAELGREGLRRLITKDPFNIWSKYEELRHVDWPALPGEFAGESMARGSSVLVFSGKFASDNWLSSFNSIMQPPWTEGIERAERILDPERKAFVLKVTYPAGKFGNEQGGTQWLTYLGRNYDRLALSYDVKFEPGFPFVKGGKLPGLLGGHQEGHPNSTLAGGHKPSGIDGWSARIMWRRKGHIVQYVYHPDQPDKFGQDFPWMIDGKPARFAPGKWHNVKTEVSMNSPAKKNGSIQSWLDGVKALDVRNIRFRDVDRVGIDALYFSTFFGGEDTSWAPPREVATYFDKFIITK